tara:strand:- start:1167 stop:1526 length:360 start_codon:yes stop_codon:yes gene_type:complete
MLSFGSRNFGQANFGKGLITTAVDETLTTSNMDVAGYLLFNTGTLIPQATVNVDIAAGIQRMGFLDIRPSATVITSGIKMEWMAWTNLGVGTSTVQSHGYIAWDSQLVDDTTWTTQEVD